MKLRRRRIRFSLRSLLLAAMFAGSGMLLFMKWAPWQAEFSIYRQTVAATVCSPDGSLLAVSYYSDNSTNMLELWELKSHTVRFQKECIARGSPLQFSAGGEWIILGSQLIRATTGDSIQLHESEYCIEVWPDDSKALLLDRQGYNIHIIELPTSKPIVTLKTNEGDFWARISSDGKRFIAGVQGWPGASLFLYETETMKATSLPDDAAWRFSKDLTRYSMWDHGPSVSIYDTANGKIIRTIPEVGFSYSPDHKFIVTVAQNDQGSIWNIETGERVAVLDQVHRQSKETWGLFYLENGEKIFGWKAGKGFARWNLTGGKPEAEFSTFVDFTADSSRAISRSYSTYNDFTCTIYDGSTGQLLYSIPGKHASPIPKSNDLVSWGNDFVHIWSRRRPEYWWGVAWLPEFWLTVVFTVALLWSLRRDWREARAAV